ncbi:dsDNA nuclease domain-containing protein [Thermoanaerobacter wiegelii]|uniref:NACHT domain-containing protein n=1 Tax=Thermoanaerobacter wiegelii Rt8.B1 TaxID=697303 RepID=G2MTW1_9THEO|nr:dsDNA nuclease domain-containing protein [Thermoanaerobacter wiegelii]AEM79496.1 hypothetical protein Thewi_2147 [Thermoanaerobacter wiegelii Rt8.B1]
MNRKNPTSPIRSGLDFQDLWGAFLCVEWLKNPDKYKWIRFETVPDELNDRNFFLDDIILCTQDDTYHVYQLKHKQNPKKDKWNWDSLLKQESNSKGEPKNSLIQKWFKSMFKPELDGKISFAAFVSNGIADEDIQKCLDGDKIDISLVKSNFPEVYAKIKEQLVDEIKIEIFFNEFHFYFGQKNVDELEQEIRKILQEDLGVTENGATNLLSQIHKESRKPYTNRILIEQIRNWCEWDNPRPLNENFQIPEDFVFFDREMHEKIISDLMNPEGGIKVFYGKPGSGKSTYLSKLHKLLTERKVISVRHHYHIAPNDPNPIDRLESQRVIESIKYQFKQHYQYLGNLAHKNSKNITLREYIAQLAGELYEKGKAFVLIIDGLDHVLKYRDEKELSEFLKEVCYPQPGLWLLIGMQMSAKEYLPQIIFEKCPEEQWIEIKGISKDAVEEILNANLLGLNLPKDSSQKKALVEKLFGLTEGNPLHLRYTLRELKNKLGNKLLTVFDCDDLLPYGGEIFIYYNSLWRKLPETSKTFAFLVAIADFSFKKFQLFEILPKFEDNPIKIQEGFKAISHLLDEKSQGIFIYHNSFETFILDRPELHLQEKPIKRILKEWLEESPYEELKWAELRKLYYDLGNPEPILELNRDWLLDAICYPRDPLKIVAQLRLGIKAALERGLYGKAYELSKLKTYYENSLEYIDESAELIWEVAFLRNERKEEIYKRDLNKLYSKNISIIVEAAVKDGETEIINDAIEVLNSRHENQTIRTKGDIGAEVPQISRYLLEVVSCAKNISSKKVYHYIKQFRNTGWSSDLFGIYSAALLKSKQLTKVLELLGMELTKEERNTILNNLAEYGLKYNDKNIDSVISAENKADLSYFCLLYLLIKGVDIGKLPKLPNYDDFPYYVKEYETGKRTERAKIFSNNFFLGVMYGLRERESEVFKWIEGAEKRWALDVISCVFQAGIAIAKKIKVRDSIEYTTIFEYLDKVTKLRFPEHRDLLELQHSLTIALSNILKSIYLIKISLNQSSLITMEEYIKINSSKFYSSQEFIQFLLEIGTPILSTDSFRHFLEEQRAFWKRHITYFSERSRWYALLARLALIYNDVDAVNEFLNLSASNLLGYGYHKDMYLDELMDAIRECHKSGSEKSVKWISEIAPLVENVSEYTDGDETRHFPIFLAELLVNVSPELLYKYYYQKAYEEDLFLAEDIFKNVIRSLNFEADEEVWLATTALDSNSFEELKSIAANNEGANRALTIIQDYLGPVDYSVNNDFYSGPVTSSSPFPAEKKIDYSVITPSSLGQYLDGIETKWDMRQFLTEWLKHWNSREDVDKRCIYDTIKTIVEKQGLHNADEEILDFLYPLAYEFDEDINKAFEYLCWAQANHSGWGKYWSDEKRVFERWKFLKEYFPTRYMEFFKKSIYYTGVRYGRGREYFVPLLRGVQFFLFFDKQEYAEEITEAGILFAKELMADIVLPASKWLMLPEIGVIDILLQRLTWPSPFVRERAATAIASLLIDSSNKIFIWDKLIEFISNQKLESLVAIGLLPLIKAASTRPEEMNYLDIDRLISALPLTSVVIDKLVNELATLLNKKVTVPKKVIDIKPAPYLYHPSDFFLKNVTGFLAPIYFEIAKMISERTGKDFIKQWAYTADEIMEQCGFQKEENEVMHFYGGRTLPILLGMSTNLSEVYRSAFLRVLQYYYDQGNISKDLYLKYSYITLPVELSYWKIEPQRCPDWWPGFNTNVSSRDIDLSKTGLFDSLNRLINEEGDFKVIGLDGAAKPSVGWSKGNIDTRITMIAFAYEVVGNDIPLAEEVAKEIMWSSQRLIPKAPRPFNMLEASNYVMQLEEIPIEINDLVIFPLVYRCKPLVIYLWQWFRDYHPPFILSKDLDREMIIRLHKKELNYYYRDKVIVRVFDWLEGLKERNDIDMEIPHGTCILMKTEFLNKLLVDYGLRLGYVVRINYKFKKSIFDKAQSYEEYHLLGVSRIII